MNVVLKARPRMFAREIHRAGRHQEVFMDQVNHAIGEVRGKIRPKINGAIFLQATRDINARILFIRGVLNVRICFVVAKQDVEFRLVLLDEVVFERQRFFLVVDDDIFQIGDLANERSGLGVLLAFV